MSTQYPPLPYRRLKLMANGIWDEARKEFYPFKISNGTVTAKPGIMYFVVCAQTTCYNTGDKASSYCRWTGNVGGSTKNLCVCSIAASVAASNVNQTSNGMMELNILLDTGKAITLDNTGPTLGYGTIVYAEIPDDLGWVVVE